jgi:hypothetical protein
METMSLGEFLTAYGLESAAPILEENGIERLADLSHLTADDMEMLEIPADVVGRICWALGRGGDEVVAASTSQPSAAPAVAGTLSAAQRATAEVAYWLAYHGLSEVQQRLVESGVERLADLSQLNADDLDTVGVPDHLKRPFLVALGLEQPQDASASAVVTPAALGRHRSLARMVDIFMGTGALVAAELGGGAPEGSCGVDGGNGSSGDGEWTHPTPSDAKMYAGWGPRPAAAPAATEPDDGPPPMLASTSSSFIGMPPFLHSQSSSVVLSTDALHAS